MLYLIYNNLGEVEDIVELNKEETTSFLKAFPSKELILYDELTNSDFTFDDGEDFESDIDC